MSHSVQVQIYGEETDLVLFARSAIEKTPAGTANMHPKGMDRVLFQSRTDSQWAMRCTRS